MSLPTPYYETDLGRLYCGDCLDILPHLEPVDLVLTDPPYGIGYVHGGGGGGLVGRQLLGPVQEVRWRQRQRELRCGIIWPLVVVLLSRHVSPLSSTDVR
jgi:hypothetical protein